MTTRKGLSTRDKKYSLLHTPQTKGSKNDQTMVGDQRVRPLLRSLLPRTDSTGMYEVQRQDTIADLFMKELLLMEQYRQRTYEKETGIMKSYCPAFSNALRSTIDMELWQKYSMPRQQQRTKNVRSPTTMGHRVPTVLTRWPVYVLGYQVVVALRRSTCASTRLYEVLSTAPRILADPVLVYYLYA